MKMIAPILAAGALAACASLPDQSVVDAAAVRDVATAIDQAVDAKDWAAARSYFLDTIDADFTSLAGGDPATIPSQALIDGWAANLGPAKTSHHIRERGLAAVDGDTARLVSNGYAWNKLEGNGDPLWEVWGVYTHDFVRTETGWKVSGFKFEANHQRGNDWVRDTPASAVSTSTGAAD